MNPNWQTVLSIIGAIGGIIALLRFYVEIRERAQKPPKASIVITTGQNPEIYFHGDTNVSLPRQVEIRNWLSVSNIGEENGTLLISIGDKKGEPKGLFRDLSLEMRIYDKESSDFKTWDRKLNGRSGPIQVMMSIYTHLLLGYDEVAIAELIRDVNENRKFDITLRYTTETPNLQTSYRFLHLQIPFRSITRLILNHWDSLRFKEAPKILYRIATGQFPDIRMD